MRNKTMTAEKNKKKPVKKGTASSLSVAQMPNRRAKSGSSDKKIVLTKNNSRNFTSSKNRPSFHVEASKRRIEQIRRMQTESASSRKSEIEGNNLKSRNISSTRNRSETVSKNRPVPSRVSTSKQKESEDDLKDKILANARQTGASNSSRPKGSSKLLEDKDNGDKNESQRKKSKESSDIEDEEDEDDKADDGKGGTYDRITKQRPVVGSQAKGKEESDGKNKTLRLDDKKPSVNPRDSKSLKFDVKESPSPAKSEGSNDKDKGEKTSKQKDDSKVGDKNKEGDRQESKILRAGLAEDRPKSSPKKPSASESKKKQNDIKLEEDSLDPEDHAISKTTAKDPTLSGKQTSSFGSTMSSTKKDDETNSYNAVLKKLTSNVADQNILEPTPDKQIVNSNNEKETTLDTISAEDLAEIGLSSANPNSETGKPAQANTLPYNISQIRNATSSRNSGKGVSGNEISNERFYIEGQLHFGNVKKSQGVANMRISRGMDRDSQDPTGPVKTKGSDPSLDSKDAASSIWNALHAVLGSQRPAERNQIQDTFSEKVKPATTQLTSKEEFPLYQYKTDVDGNTVRGTYVSNDYITGSDYGDEYETGDDSDEGEYGEDGDGYTDTNEYGITTPEADVAYYQNYHNGPQGYAQYSPRNRMYPILLNRGRTSQHLNFRDSLSFSNVDQNQNVRTPTYTQRGFGSYLKIPENQLISAMQSGQAQQNLPIENNENAYTVATKGFSERPEHRPTPYDQENIDKSIPEITTDSASEAGQSQANIYASIDKTSLPEPSPQALGSEIRSSEAGIQPEEMASRISMQTSARERMQSYASLSAQADPTPVEIKPLSHIQKLQKIHTIPQ